MANLVMIPLVLADGQTGNQNPPGGQQHPDAVDFSCSASSDHLRSTTRSLVVTLILFFGLLAFVLEENGFPIAPAILGVVLGKMLEENFVTSMIKSDGDPLVFFTRPIAMWLALATFVVLLWPVGAWAVRKLRSLG